MLPFRIEKEIQEIVERNVAPHFTEYQKHSVNFGDIPFELWEIFRFQNGMIGLSQHQPSSGESIASGATAGGAVANVSKEVKKYTEEYLFQRKSVSPELRELYARLKERILELGDVRVVAHKNHITFKGNRAVAFLGFQQRRLSMQLCVEKKALEDPKNVTRDTFEEHVVWHHDRIPLMRYCPSATGVGT